MLYNSIRTTSLSLLLTSCLLFLGSSVSAQNMTDGTTHRRDECGTHVTEDDIANAELAISRLKLPRQASVREYTFDVHFTIVAANMTERAGWVPNSQIEAQMKMLNERYAGTGVSWRHAGITRVLSRYWHDSIEAGLQQTNDMHSLFRTGKSTTMNVYTVGFTDASLNGYSTLPVNYARNPIEDGVVIFFATLPGGLSLERQGGTLIHEAGHWLGLRHTFQGGCTGVGDGVDDTPPQREEHYGCPIGADTCPGGGPDPIYNFMDYTSEECRTEFTPGQISLMQKSIAAFRSNSNR
ncbi:hypothetical protein D9613_006331 [Agrocybe pediades]|uniref:Peptidase M43 pregnancy-associated plasma-A domain-containing protein n=1 Tax=Agrocybe pediades TaxID=84607 RepID=A0A8H4VPR9_9AGAR|nr:hypothetical protein D9613_006331 [Agrocybe pediades]